MLIVPLRGPGVRKTVPLAVILLVIANVLVFLSQANDDKKQAAAFEFYQQSMLFRVEPDLYQRWLKDHQPARPARAALRGLKEGPLSERDRGQLAMALQIDGPFLNVLESGQLIAPSNPQWVEWHQARANFMTRLRASVAHAGAFVPREHRWHTFLTSMFLHADPGHLIGNMVFLWLAGVLLESLVGFLRFLGLYLFTGLVSCALSWAMAPTSAILELGASGAVSGVMGALATTYGARMIPCLFNIGLYAWRGRMQGYWLAGVWVVWEGVQWVLFPSNVNRAAHIGGLLAGALIGAVLGRRKDVAQKTEENPRDLPRQMRERARRQAADLNFESAAHTMLSVVRRSQQADDWQLLWAYARHVLDTRAGQAAQQAILAERPQRSELRQALLALQAEVRRRQPGPG